MLAGALFNRATDIFRKLVELQADGVEIQGNPLTRECGKCLIEAMNLGHSVLHRSGEGGIDELWGEPFRRHPTTLLPRSRTAVFRCERLVYILCPNIKVTYITANT